MRSTTTIGDGPGVPGTPGTPGGARRGAAPAAFRVAAAVAAWLVLALAVGNTVHSGGPVFSGTPGLLAWYATAWAVFAVAAWLLCRVPLRAAVPLLVAGGLGLSVIALSGPPRTSDDLHRYVWDGRIQAAGVDPYRYPPQAPQLQRFRDPWLWPSPQACRELGKAPGCTRINRPTVTTIYPPVAEAWFLLVHAASPPEARHKPVQVGAAVLTVLTTLALIAVLRRNRGDPRVAVLWAWSPVVAVEAVNNAHVDVLGALLVVLGLGALAARHPVRSGVLLGAAVAVKLLPALVLPAALSRRAPIRRSLTVLAAAAATVTAGYLPHVLAVGTAVLGYLPGYLHEEGYAGTHRFGVLRIVLPQAVSPYAAAALLAATALLVMWRTDPDRPWRGALVMTGTALLVTTPTYPWYALLLAALVALDGRWEWLAVAIAPMVVYAAIPLGLDGDAVQRWAYGGALAAVALVSAGRRVMSGPGAALRPHRPPTAHETPTIGSPL